MDVLFSSHAQLPELYRVREGRGARSSRVVVLPSICNTKDRGTKGGDNCKGQTVIVTMKLRLGKGWKERKQNSGKIRVRCGS